MGPCNASGVADESDHLPALHRFTDMDERFAHMEVGGNYTAAMVDVNDVACQEEIVHERNDAAIGCPNRLTDRTAEINAEMARGQFSVEDSARAERAGNYRCPWLDE